MSHALERYIAQKRLDRGWRHISSAYLARPWPSRAQRRMVIFYDANDISYTQLYPFIHYHKDFQDRYGVAIRCFPFENLSKGIMRGVKGTDIILLEPWFTIDPAQLRNICDTIQKQAPHAELSFIDSFAHNDVRLAPALPDELRFYLKKSLYVDPKNYMIPFRGDVMHFEFYSDLYGLEAEARDFGITEDIVPKLRLSPNFFTAPHLINGFNKPSPPVQDGRNLDVMTRLGAKGPPRYSAIRRANLEVLDSIKGISVSEKNRISHEEYMAEMRRAKLCFSPFGYGELCWRDIEAIREGSVLIKQDMSHLKTLPDLYEAGKTYLPVKWDLSNLEEVIRAALEDKDLRTAITTEAFNRVATYVKDRQFVTDMGFLFAQ